MAIVSLMLLKMARWGVRLHSLRVNWCLIKAIRETVVSHGLRRKLAEGNFMWHFSMGIEGEVNRWRFGFGWNKISPW